MRTTVFFGATTPTAKSSPFESLPPTPAMAQQQRSPWHSPVPYLFGGLAAMLGLIAFALLILACSYWKLSSRLGEREGGEGDLENGGDEKDHGGESSKTVKVFEEKILVIMAGNENPTFLATPVSVCSKVACFGPESPHVDDHQQNKEESSEKLKEELRSHDHGEAVTVSEVQNRDEETQQTQLEEEEETRH